MKHPAYHLQPNKTAERFVFIEAIKRLERLSTTGLREYIYHGLGGPYLEEFRLLYEHCPDIGMVSIESNLETYKRQWFHRPSSKVRLVRNDMASFIAHFSPENLKSVFWLDYTELKYRCFGEFPSLLARVEEMSMIKVSLRCDPSEYVAIGNERLNKQKAEEFRSKFEKVMPHDFVIVPRKPEGFAELLQEMLRVAVGQALPATASPPLTFIPISSFRYRDTTEMFTLTGVVCDKGDREKVEQNYADWEFANFNWGTPTLIDVPVLSTKERLHLQRFLPLRSMTGNTLRHVLGYKIDKGARKTEASLEMYAKFHKCSPYFLRGVP